MHLKSLILVSAAMPLCFAQQWGIGGIGGYAITRDATISNSSGSISAGLKNGPVFGALISADDHRYVGGEVTYLYQQSDFRLKGSGAEPAFGGYTQFIDFRVTVHAASRDAAVRPFIAAGGGAAVYTGTGTESSRQPLNNFAALTATRDTLGMLSVGGGVKVRLSQHVGLRFEVRDNMTPFPEKVMTPVPGASASGWLHNIIPSVAILGTF
jgi:hypothetical protein